MHRVSLLHIRRLFGVILMLAGLSGAAMASDPVVNTVFFWSNYCPYCHTVAQEHLPPIINRFGNRLQIAGINVDTQEGAALYQAVVDHFSLPQERIGVPALLIGDTVLVGLLEIPQRLPGMVERSLAAGGVDWSAVPALRSYLTRRGLLVEEDTAALRRAAEAAAAEEAEQARREAEVAAEQARRETEAEAAERARRQAEAAAEEEARRLAEARRQIDSVQRETEITPPVDSVEEALPPTPPAADAAAARDQVGGILWSPGEVRRLGVAERFTNDLAGNSVAVLVLIALIIGLVRILRVVVRLGRWPEGRTGPAVPLLVLVGLPIAVYLGLMEYWGSPVVCGPVGRCNIVQSSEYAKLFGVIPNGFLGTAGYIAILSAWLVASAGPTSLRRPAALALWGMALFGVLFSIYLTFLEPFVIGASCAWCLTSAVLMLLILFAVTPSGLRAAPAHGTAEAPAREEDTDAVHEVRR